jgi:glycosyltransferase involved in cell wall biosynthesis
MKLLILNERVDENDAVLGIYTEWINEFGNQLDEVYVVTQFKGRARLRRNVHVVSLGKEKGLPKVVQLKNFYSHVGEILPKVDFVLAHMSPVWIILAAPLLKLYNKPSFLWYAHKHVDAKLRLAERIVKGVFASVPGSIGLKGEKVRLVGQGIPLHRFPFKKGERGLPSTLKLVSIGRLTSRKDYVTIVRACAVLRERGRNVRLRIVGPALTPDEAAYERVIRGEIKRLKLEKFVKLTGPVPNKDVPKEYYAADVLVNAASKTGADKVVFEALCTGCIPVACDPALRGLLADSRLLFSPGNFRELARVLDNLASLGASERGRIRAKMRAKMEKEHNSRVQIARIIGHMKRFIPKGRGAR